MAKAYHETLHALGNLGIQVSMNTLKETLSLLRIITFLSPKYLYIHNPYSFSISSSIPYIALKCSRSAGLFISITSSILPVCISLKPATCSPLQMLALITGFLFSS